MFSSSSSSSTATLTVPEGSIASSVEISMVPYPVAGLPMPSGLAAVDAWMITPHGLTFETPARLSIRIVNALSGDVVVGRLDDENDTTWDFSSDATVNGQEIELLLSSLSIYAVMTGTDTDGDGVPDGHDAFPTDPNESKDSDGDGIGDNADSTPTDGTQCTDSDDDTCDDCSNGSVDPANDGTDSNADGLCDACDVATCSAKGTCTDSSGVVTCECVEGSAGGACDGCDVGYQDNDGDGSCVAACNAETCSGNGTCDDASGAAVCACDSAYTGIDCSTCAAGFQDNDNDGVCQPDCTGNDCSGHGTCSDVSGMATCACETGHTGTDCSGCGEGFQDRDGDGVCKPACDVNSCSGNGSCDDATGSATCACNSGYAGTSCAECAAGYQDNDGNGICELACDVDTCSGRGTCSDASGTATCACNTGYTGSDCSVCDTGYQDNDADGTCEPECTATTCSGHGTCDDASGTAVCTCDVGHSGADCSGCGEGYQDRDGNGVCQPACDVNTCSGNGSCDDSSGTAMCTCNEGYANADCSVCATGYQDNDNDGTCEVECTATTCSGHGTCSDASGLATCTCDTGYTGADCSACDTGYQDNDNNGTCEVVCTATTCSGHGTCSDASGMATCTCDSGYTGADCSGCDAGFQDKDNDGSCLPACDVNTCSGHGACDDSSGTATCTCNTGYTGASCSACDTGYQDNDNDGTCEPSCNASTCSSHGTCSDASGTATCTCDTGYAGVDCSSCATGYQDNDNDGTCAPDCTTANPNCNGNGTCNDASGAAVCDCDAGWTGADCSTPEGPPTPTFLWLDATDASTITKDASNNVTEWRDKSGLNRHATVSGAAPLWQDAVINGKPAIFFNGSSVRLQTAAVPTSSEMTIFVVFNMVSPQTWGSIINQAHDTYFSIRKSDCCGGGGQLNFHIQNNNAAPLRPITTNAWKLLTTMRQGTTSTMYYDPSAPAVHNGDTLTGGVNVPISIGNSSIGSQSMGGYIAEIRAYSSALSPAQRAAVEADLNAKYGLSVKTFTFTETAGDDIAPTALSDFFSGVSAGASDYIMFEIDGVWGGGIDYGAWCATNAAFYTSNYLANTPSATQTGVPTGNTDRSIWVTYDTTVPTPTWEPATVTSVNNYYGGSGDQYVWLSEWCVGTTGKHLCHWISPGRTDGAEMWPDNPAAAGTRLRIVVGENGASRMDVCGF